MVVILTPIVLMVVGIPGPLLLEVCPKAGALLPNGRPLTTAELLQCLVAQLNPKIYLRHAPGSAI